MIDFELSIDGQEEKIKVTATARDVLTWEKTTKGGSLIELLANPKMADLYKVAHLAAWRQKVFQGTLAEFEERCDVDFDLEELQDGDDASPDPS